MAEPFARFLRRSLAAVEAECPTAWRQLTDVLGGHALLLTVDGQPTSLACRRGEIFWETQPSHDLSLTTERSAILALIDGLSLADAVFSGRVRLVGPPDEVIRFDAALTAYLHGVVRSPSQPGLLRRYRADTPQNAS